jgi:hypothetical protein
MASLSANQALKSKTNYVALALTVVGFLTDPNVIGVVPPEVASWILKLSGPVLFILKTFFTKQVPEDKPLNIP